MLFFSRAREVFTKLRQAFVKASILNHFDLEYYCRILIQLTLDNLDQWNLMALFSQKMISVKIRYDTHNDELMAIVKVFKTWRYYLKGCKHEILYLLTTATSNAL